MSPRPLELFDLPKLAGYRSEVLLLDSRQGLTRGNPLHAKGFLAYLNPTRRVYTGISDKRGVEIVGGIMQRDDEQFARLSYLAPKGRPANASLGLIDHLVAQAGKWGAHLVAAEVEENHPYFQSLRRTGFTVCGRQRIWRFDGSLSADEDLPAYWEKEKVSDLPRIQRLQRDVIPPLLLQIEQAAHPSTGLVCKADELLAYLHVDYGSQAIFLRPLIHPNVDDIQLKLRSFLAHLPSRRALPVYISLRSHQAWIEGFLDHLGASAGPRQAVMVKHLAHLNRKKSAIPAGGDRVWANPAASISGSSVTMKTTKDGDEAG